MRFKNDRQRRAVMAKVKAMVGRPFNRVDVVNFGVTDAVASKVPVKEHGSVIGSKHIADRRDVLLKEDGKVKYYVWGNRIATYNLKSKKLSVTSAGWETNLIKDRFNRVLPAGNKVVQEKFVWNLRTASGKNIPFKKRMSFKLKR